MGGILWPAGLSVLPIPTGLLLYGENHSEAQAISPSYGKACVVKAVILGGLDGVNQLTSNFCSFLSV
ncbi:hypothetical protein M404DRAFT_1006245 [Pisolithus tinctorius Marx 270]|uniref:Uncharacterized protein n=1 Tax=Pisolithus tinctorius Marx 270 TaxID=870435 RepID=A0A0C3NPH7_PISTI|nr:hypothetical protein M404DRAFT_1006245 [Pisolithus tinctorius Marx 270]